MKIMISLREQILKNENDDNKYNSLINRLLLKAAESKIDNKLSAAIMQNNKLLIEPQCNIHKSSFNNIPIGSLHAEVNAIKKYFGKSFYYNYHKKDAYIPINYKKRKKIDLFVIRINKTGDLCNGRPCYNCLNIMKAVGIRKVYYSVSNNTIISENVDEMVSIQASYVTRDIDIKKINKEKSLCIKNYYDNLLRNQFPDIIKKYNLYKFIEYNLSIILPNYKFEIYNNYVHIIDPYGNVLIKALIIE
jgi:hypothetical protein